MDKLPPESPKTLFQQEFIDHFFIQLADRVKYAGIGALSSEYFLKNQSVVNILPMNVNQITREIRPLQLDFGEPVVTYDSNDITVVGGSALIAYKSWLSTIGYPYMGRKTTDIDFVWWPRSIQLSETDQIHQIIRIAKEATLYKDDNINFSFIPIDRYISNTNYTVVSTSPSITNLAKEMKKYLQSYMDNFINVNGETVYNMGSRIFSLNRDENIHISVDHMHVYKAGVHQINCTLHFGKEQFKIIEISIHDGGSSQKSKMIEPVYTDPIFLLDTLNIHSINIDTLFVKVPNLYTLISQQWFALRNKLNVYWYTKSIDERRKLFTFYQRIAYLINLISFIPRTYHDNEIYNMVIGKKLSAEELSRVKTIPTHPDFLASCPVNKQYCLSSGPTEQMLIDLCNQGRVVNTSLCIANGNRKTRRTRARR